MNLVIVADGTFPTHPLPLATLRDADLIIACDGAAKTLLHAGFMPHCVVGDLDTLEQEIQQQLKDRLEHETEQETNDLSKAFRSALRKMSAADTLTILGATGKREDHTLGNLSLLADFAGQHRKIRLLTDHGTFLPVTDCDHITQKRQTFGVELGTGNGCFQFRTKLGDDPRIVRITP